MGKKKPDIEFIAGPSRNDTIEVMGFDEDDDELTAAEQMANAAIEELRSKAEHGKNIKVFRQLGYGNESFERVGSWPVDEYPLDNLIEKIHNEYGGGAYRFMVYDERGKVAANKLIKLAVKIDKSKTGDTGADAFSLLNNVMEKQDKMTQYLLSNKNTDSESGDSRMNFMKELVIMKEIFDGPKVDPATVQTPMQQMKEMLTVMTMLKEAANPVTEKEDDGGSWTSMLKEAFPLLNTVAQASLTNRQQPVPAQHRQSNQKKRRQRKPQQPQNEENSVRAKAIAILLEKCLNGEPADHVAKEIYEQIPKFAMPQIETLVLSDDPLAEMVEINHAVNDHAEWFTDCIEWLKGYLGYDCKYDDEFVDEGEEDEPTPSNEPPLEEKIVNEGLQDSDNETIIDQHGDSK